MFGDDERPMTSRHGLVLAAVFLAALLVLGLVATPGSECEQQAFAARLGLALQPDAPCR